MPDRLSAPSRIFVAAVLVGVLACKPQAGESAGPSGAQAVAAPTDALAGQTEPREAGAPAIPWPDKSTKQRQEWMMVDVLPRMKTAFQAHDRAAFTGFNCASCHGADMKERQFAMPSDTIMALDPTDPVGTSMDYNKELTTFMLEQVVPQMADSLNTTPFDPQTGQGFGCFGCHQKE